MMIRKTKDIDAFLDAVRDRYEICWLENGNPQFLYCFDTTEDNHDKNIRILLSSPRLKNVKTFVELPKLYESINLPIPGWYYE